MSLFLRAVLPTARLNWASNQQLYRPFTTSILLRAKKRPGLTQKPPRVSRPKPKRKQPEKEVSEEEYHQAQEDEPPRRFESSKLVVKGIIGACSGILMYNAYLQSQVETDGSFAAKQKLEKFHENFVMSWKGIQEGRYYTALTSAFMHSGLPHLGMNMMGIWGLSPPIIQLFGAKTFAVLFVGSALTGAAVQYYTWKVNKDYNGAAVGASGSVFGILAALTCVMPRSSMSLMFLPMPMAVGLGLSVVASVAGMMGYWGSNIGHADHLGGMAFGAVFWALVLRRRPYGYLPYAP